jgi:hypothetical protein
MANMRATMDKVVDPRRLEAVEGEKNDLLIYIIGIIVIVTAVSVFHVWSRVRVMDLNLQMAIFAVSLRRRSRSRGD